jgi:hypothetical protein
LEELASIVAAQAETCLDHLEGLLDELVALLVDGRVPDGAVVARWPG